MLIIGGAVLCCFVVLSISIGVVIYFYSKNSSASVTTLPPSNTITLLVTPPPKPTTTFVPTTTTTFVPAKNFYCNDSNYSSVMKKYPYWIETDKRMAVNILANIMQTNTASLNNLANVEIYKKLKSYCG